MAHGQAPLPLLLLHPNPINSILMTWDSFIFFAIPALLLWAGGAWTAWKKRPLPTYLLTAAGLLVYFAFILGLWMSLERPPLRTMGETRLWYAFFLPTAGLIVYSRWRYPWILAFSTILAGVFTTINIVNPDIHNKTLMPALQSPWFAPHVIVYMFDRRYSLRGALGEGSLGALLGVGPQGDLGCCYMVCLSGLYPRAHPFGPLPPCSALGALHLLHPPADVLVGHQLPTLCPRRQRPHLQPGLRLSVHKPL